ncbi:NUDIX domain-containing protein [Haladaptatus salinisoli]|uniref:NUDIX domain-containing protein n=1 Tax=Haladaptatus salinisoli TaxID=2884876 RepID=UPI001D0B5CA7|nr:NUDIX domain-containing protein [Haladaptatus salinisoli]
MSENKQQIPDNEWATIVENVPLVSVDLVIRHDGGIVLGFRKNEPAKGEWFVPGGRVFKNEKLNDAVARVAKEELGTTVTIERQLGVYEHFYETSEVAGVESKHYLANAFLVKTDTDKLDTDDQHAEFRVFHPPFDEAVHHPYVLRYLNEI